MCNLINTHTHTHTTGYAGEIVIDDDGDDVMLGGLEETRGHSDTDLCATCGHPVQCVSEISIWWSDSRLLQDVSKEAQPGK